MAHSGGVVVPNLSQPPPGMGVGGGFRPRFQAPQTGFVPRSYAGGYQPRHRHDQPFMANSFDGKRMRNKAALRRTIDYNASMINYVESRLWQREHRDRRVLQTDPLYSCQMTPTLNMLDKPANCVATRHIRTASNKIKCPIFCVCWTPEGRRLITGASSGEFTLWNGLTFNFETILQAHDTAVREMKWSHNDQWMITADHGGYIKYWQSNMNNVKMYQAHKDPIRGLRYTPYTTTTMLASAAAIPLPLYIGLYYNTFAEYCYLVNYHHRYILHTDFAYTFIVCIQFVLWCIYILLGMIRFLYIYTYYSLHSADC